VTQKIVSKAEDRLVRLDPGDPDARRRLVEAESVRVLRRRGDLIISETRHGFVCANAGIDASNAPGEDVVVLLPVNPDASARALRARLRELRGVAPAVVISDSFGRAWRRGQADVALGCAGLVALDDWTGRADAEGRELRATQIAVADEAAAAADLARAKDSGEPVVLVRGLERYVRAEDGPGAVAGLVRARAEDLFL
jgi:coenzyme F420-0:L-glutamate ligase / coenzyme F420-1:gamma-L-glutamate ligase